VHGKPFTFSEWNAGEPGWFSADAVAIAAVVAALQDWDGVFFFNYQARQGDWDADHVHDYFDFNGQPVKMSLLASLANLYRRGDLPPLANVARAAPGEHEALGPLAMRYRVGMDPAVANGEGTPVPATVERARRLKTPRGDVVWDIRDASRAQVQVNTPATRMAWGLVAGQSITLGGWRLAFGPIERDYAIAVATSRDGLPLEASRSVLLTVVANAENQNMGWNSDRTSVGSDWGHGPAVVLGVPLQLTIPATSVACRMFALDPTGARVTEVESVRSEQGLTYQLGPRHRTLFYELAADY
jgi:hypothetical protein